MTLESKLKAIDTILLDIDGVLTDGRVGYSADTTVKFFHIRDGLAIRLALQAGLNVGILSGRDDPANRRRAEELRMTFYYGGRSDKRSAFQALLAEQRLSADACLYVGDDIVDIPVLIRAGVGVTVADAPDEVKARTDWVTTKRGGHGAVREVIVAVLEAQDKWNTIVAKYDEAS